MKNDWSEVSVEDADGRFTQKLSHMGPIAGSPTGVAARRLLVERTGLVREPVTGALDFTHPYFPGIHGCPRCCV